MVFEDINLLFSFIDPLLIFSNPAIVLNIVVLPIPEGPNKHIISPLSFIEKDTFLTFVLPPAQKSTFFTSNECDCQPPSFEKVTPSSFSFRLYA